MKIASLLFLISSNAFALNCGNLSEGEVVRMDTDNKPLARAAIQDQDGLGSCYANQASLMLQSVIPNNPNLSYLNLGLYYATDFLIPKAKESGNNTYLNANNNALIEGGFACKAINAALDRQKKTNNGVLCKSSDVAIEHDYFSRSAKMNDNQRNVMGLSAKYLTNYQSAFGKPEDLQKNRAKADKFNIALKKYFANAGDLYDKQCKKQVDDSGDKNQRANIMLKQYEFLFYRLIRNNPDCISGTAIKMTTPTCQSLSQFINIDSAAKNIFDVKISLKKEVASELKKAETTIFQGSEFPGGLDLIPERLKIQTQKLDRSNKHEKEKKVFADLLMSNLDRGDLENFETGNRYSSGVDSDFEFCKQDKFMKDFADSRFIMDARKDTVLCNYKGLLNDVQNLALSLPIKQNMSAFIDFVTDKAGLKFDEAILPLIATDCKPDQRVSIPENLKCDQVVMNFKAGDFKAGFAGPATQGAAEVVMANRKKMLSSIEENRAVGITICSKYWKDPSYGYNNLARGDARNKSCQNGRDSIHSITAIGYRCKNNKIQYLAQNSWGINWKEENKNLEIEKGKVWLDEDSLFQNLETIDYMSLQ
jgi:hypothetical protein